MYVKKRNFQFTKNYKTIFNLQDDSPIYNNNLPNFKDFSHVVMKGKGDFDLMMGKVSNFEFTTRADGGFNCTTTLLSN